MSYVDYDKKSDCAACMKRDYEPCQEPCCNCGNVSQKKCRICMYRARKTSICNLDENGVPIVKKNAPDLCSR